MKHFFPLFFFLLPWISVMASHSSLPIENEEESEPESNEILTERDNDKAWRLFALNEPVIKRAMFSLDSDEKSIIIFIATLLKQCENLFASITDVEKVYFTLVELANNATSIRDSMRPLTVATLIAIYYPHLRIDENFRHGFFASCPKGDAFIEVLFETGP